MSLRPLISPTDWPLEKEPLPNDPLKGHTITYANS